MKVFLYVLLTILVASIMSISSNHLTIKAFESVEIEQSMARLQTG